MPSESRQKTRKRQPGTQRPLEPPQIARVSNGRLALSGTLLFLGFGLWLLTGNDAPPLRWIIVVATMAIAAVPAINAKLAGQMERVRELSPAVRWKLALLMGAVASGYLVATAFNQNRDLFPKMQDECSYVLGARMLSQGRLWMPAHALPDFFEIVEGHRLVEVGRQDGMDRRVVERGIADDMDAAQDELLRCPQFPLGRGTGRRRRRPGRNRGRRRKRFDLG